MSSWQQVIDRAKKDLHFRDRLRADPVAAALEMGLSIPAGTTVEVMEQGLEQSVDQAELNDLELAAVAGGGLLANLALRPCLDKIQDTPGDFVYAAKAVGATHYSGSDGDTH